ncbi:apolipoprotein N-acyltransferase [Novosphingobium chloroacetimidivorans]|uniref:Apolipoprotein N-acyltransferase n=1 Tax=Novosphingobium chloroacetimidivorans TaxID=1428314 RepID=A0A7W7KD19_9SPHN|nr:sugar transporter [Novosphingobium chloroacetimidivorans]MBB4859863.1 apolipoprotein N-acyltransferase [Novosphingobium chloroacetimidivorans]
MKRMRLVAILILLWSLAGVAAFAMQATAEPATLGDPVTARAFAAMPAWAWTAYAVAVFSSLAGAVALLMRRRVAWILFAISAVAVVLQFSWTVFGFGLLSYKGPDALIFPVVIVAIALVSSLHARRQARVGGWR